MRGKRRSVWLVATLVSAPAWAGDAGSRDFPATLVVDEPQVETEFSPQIADWSFGDRTRRDISSELSLQVATPLSVIISPVYTALRSGGGFQALGLGTKYQFVANADHEIVFSAGLSSTLGDTGSPFVGADSFSSIIPTIYFGKGAGDLPDMFSWARPFALTEEIALAVPSRLRSQSTDFGIGAGEVAINPVVVVVQGSFQYNLAYAEDHNSIAVPNAFASLVPLLEYEIAIPFRNSSSYQPTTGTINPGFLLIDEKNRTTWGLEALIPINRASGNHPGARLQLSYSFDTPWRLVGSVPY